ncbi:MAG: amidase family protein [Candidatus Carsonella ruddii]
MNFLCKLGIKKILILIKNRKISNYELTKCCINNIFKILKKNNFNIDLYYKESLNFAKKMDNLKKILLPISLKNIFLTNKKQISCNSKLLKNTNSLCDSNIIKILKKNNFNIISFDKLDEFCIGSTGLNNNNLKNNYNNNNFTGGSSSGSSLNISYGCNLISLASDTGGSVRTPASFCNIVGYKPTNGIFSRNGMFNYSSYLDNCSIITNNSEDCKFIFNILKNKNLDISSNYKYIYFNFKKKNNFIILNYKEQYSSKEECLLFENIIKNLEELKFNVINKKINFFSFINFYEILSSKEFYSNSCKYDGIKYGFKKYIYKNENDFIKLNRIFFKNCKNKILQGKNFLNFKNYFNIEKIKKFYIECFLKANFLLIPTNLDKFILIDNKYSDYIDFLSVFSNLIGYPSININMGKINHSFLGFQIIADKHCDLDLINISILYESFNFKKYVYC